MTPEFFADQITRLRTEWANAYGKERMHLLFTVFAEVPNEVFRDAVDELLLEHKGGPPMRREIEKAVEDARTRWKVRQWEQAPPRHGTSIETDTTPTPDRLKKVHELVKQVTEGRVLPAKEGLSFQERQRRRTEQLRQLSPQEKAAGGIKDDE